ncbi:polysaccharide deacetylase family protein [Erysipelothrix urinaevulpis]|uniref:polysaccharide deacetylase family protein n=1 Tax=Erysipelothrix urinaevulpis TaxID=2683717 RepID=UPI00135AEAC3|nr:polysaccharide deacetylase family protein [Erysipelothrix urinaevulpis]
MQVKRNTIQKKAILALVLLGVLVIGLGVLYKVTRYPSELTQVSLENKTVGSHEQVKEKNDTMIKVYHYPKTSVKSLNQWIENEHKHNDEMMSKLKKAEQAHLVKQDYSIKETDDYLSVALILNVDGKPQKQTQRTFSKKDDTMLPIGALFNDTGQNIISSLLRNNYKQEKMSRNDYLQTYSAAEFKDFYIDEETIKTMHAGQTFDLPLKETLTYLKNNIGKHTVSKEPTPSVYLDAGVDPDKKLVAFTFDDGPHWEVTEKIMDTLEKYDGQGTFFMVGQRVEESKDYPRIVKSVLDRGHQLANHSYSHENFNSLEKKPLNEQIDKTNDIFYKATGYKGPYMVRPPYGNANEFVRNNTNSVFVNWSVDTLDWQSRNKNAICNEIQKQSHDGAIILIHDLYETSYEGFECGIKKLADEGYTFVTVEELFKARGIQYETGEIYTWGPKAN